MGGKVRCCCVSGCDSQKGTPGCSFHLFPPDSSKFAQARRKLWLAAVFGEGCSAQTISKSATICGKHFVTGKPAKITETSAVNWIPTLHLDQGSRVAPKIKTICGLSTIEDGIQARMVNSNEHDLFQEDSSLVTVKEEEATDESPKKLEQVIFKEQRVLRITRGNEADPFQEDFTVETIKEEVLDEEENIKEEAIENLYDQTMLDDNGELFLNVANQCMFCLKTLPQEEQQDLQDFNKERKFRTQVEYVLAKTINAPSCPCCNTCKRMFQQFYNFKKSCLEVLAKPPEQIKSAAQKRPTEHAIEPTPKRKPKAVTVHAEIECPSPIESFSDDGDDEPEESKSRYGKTEERLRCKNCGTMYEDKFTLREHKRTCLPPKEKPRCHLCPSVLRNNWELQVHLNRHNGVTPFLCRNEGCSKAFFGPIFRMVHEKSCKKTDKVVCPTCGMAFKSNTYLQRHMASHEAPKYECAVCRRMFCDVTNFRAHMMRHFERNETPAEPDDHSVELDFQCDSCEQAFDKPEVLNGHKVYCGKNAKFRKFQLLCPLCPESFHKQEKLDQHLNRHKGIKSIPCRKEGCDKMFFDTPGRNVHELYRCGRGGTHACSVCEEAFETPAALKIHVKSHK